VIKPEEKNTEDETLRGTLENPAVQPEQESEEEIVTFLDRLIAFLLLVGPWSYLTVLLQELLQELVPVKVVNMVVLAGLIFFLVAVGWLSRRVRRFRMARREQRLEAEGGLTRKS
jgi:membrane protein YdbS with pleckstrin-like domain